MKIQIDTTDELNTKLKIYKEIHKFNNLQDAIINILNDYFNKFPLEIK